MAFSLGQVTDFDDPNTILTPSIMATAKAVNLPKNKGVFYQLMRAPRQAISQKKFQLNGRTVTGMSGVVGDGAATGWDNSATTGLAMTVGAMNVVTIGSVIKVESEVVVVSAVDRSANTIDVFARGMGGTTAAAHADTTAFSVVGFAGRDVDLKNVESRSESTFEYINYAQTVFETIDYVQSEALTGRKGLDSVNLIPVLREEAMKRVARVLSTSAINGYKHAGSKSIPYLSAGLLSQLSDDASGTRPLNRYNANGALTEAKLKAALKDTFDKGNPDTILTSPTNKEVFNNFVASRVVERADRIAGSTVMQYEYEGALLDIVVDADIPDTNVPIVTLDRCQKGFLEGDVIRYQDEPKVSSREHRESLQGSIGFIIEGVGYDHCDIYGIS